MELEMLPGRYAVCRLDPDSVQPIWARTPAGGDLLSVTWSDTEMSVVCPEDRVPANLVADRGFAVLRVRGTPEAEPNGGLASLTVPLADQGVPVYTISTQDTDHLLLPADDVGRAIATLAAAGHTLVGAEHSQPAAPPEAPQEVLTPVELLAREEARGTAAAAVPGEARPGAPAGPGDGAQDPVEVIGRTRRRAPARTASNGG